jgi:hypothetical protein
MQSPNPDWLAGETSLFVHSALDSVAKVQGRYEVTNWALRVGYSQSIPHLDPCIVPVSTIFSIKKTGGKKRAGWYGVALVLATSSRFRIECSRHHRDRPLFVEALHSAVANPLRSPESLWSCPLDWCDRLFEMSNWQTFTNTICPTYPPRFLVPRGLARSTIIGCANYRTHHRLPILSYVFPGNLAPLLRASQPRTGITGSASPADQDFIAAVCAGRRLSILDCRPRLNAVVNQFTGGGYERPGAYPNCSFEFLNIPNIHRVRECCQEMIESFRQQKPRGYGRWGALTLQLIKGAVPGIERLRANEVTTDGWDRTAHSFKSSSIQPAGQLRDSGS